MKFLHRVWQDIKSGHNLDIYITVAIAMVVAILGVLGVADDKIVFSAVLATLALVSSSLLVNRRENEEIRSALSNVTTTQSVADRFFTFGYDLEQFMQQIPRSQKIYFWGTALTSHIPLLRDYLPYVRA